MNTNDTDKECARMANAYADELNAICEGRVYRKESDEGEVEWLTIKDGEEPPQGEDGEELEQVSIYDFVERSGLGDIRYEVAMANNHWQVYGGRILVAFGGPNIWITQDEVKVYWWGHSAEAELYSETKDALMDFFEENFQMLNER